MRWLLLGLIVLTGCPHKVIRPTVNSLYLSYLGDLSLKNINYLPASKGIKVAYLPCGNAWLLEQSGFDFSNLDLIVTRESADAVRTISPYGGYLIKRIGKARVCVWARFEPVVLKDSIRFLYLKQKPMLEMRSDFIITIGDSDATIDRQSEPISYRLDFAGRGLVEMTKVAIAPVPESSDIFTRYDSILGMAIFKLDNADEFIDSLSKKFGVDSIVIPDDLEIPQISGAIRLKDLGVLLDLSVKVDSAARVAYLGLDGRPLVEFLLK